MGKAEVKKISRQGAGGAALEPLDPALLRQLIGRVEELLPLPTVVNEILKVINDPYASLDRLTQIILADQALTAKILKIINSAFYCMPMRVSTVSQAVPLLGVEKIKNLAMAISLSEGISCWPGLPGLSRESLWLHGQACAVATRLLAQETGYPVSEEAMIAGMLHDVAKALWIEVFPERFGLALEAIRAGQMDPATAEAAFLTVPHATVGSWLLKQWCMPEVLQQAVAKHHLPPPATAAKGRAGRLPQCVTLGNILAKLLNLGDGGNCLLHDFSGALLKSLSLEPDDLVRVIQQFPAALQEFIEQLELKGPDSSPLAGEWLGLKKRLAEVELLLVHPEGDQEFPGPVGLLCQALGERHQTMPWMAFAALERGSSRQVALLEVCPQGPPLPRECLAAPPPVRLVVITHNGKGVPPPKVAPGITCLGPEIYLTELTAALSGRVV